MSHSFRYLVERDADFAIISAFERNVSVRKLFLENYRELDAKIIETRHSYMQQEIDYSFGESDIIFIMEDANGKFAILIEDKIKANAQPNQSKRYEDRAKSLEKTEKLTGTKIFLCAPDFYLKADSENTKGYENQISYEKICNVISEGLEKDILETASKNRACAVADAGVTSFWIALRAIVNKYYKDRLRMKGVPKEKSSGSVWQEFETGIKGCALYMKVNSRIIELEFKQMGEKLDKLNSLLSSINAKEAVRTNNGKSVSASLQIKIKEVNGLSFYEPLDTQAENVGVWLGECMSLMGIVEKIKAKGITQFPY